MIKELIEKIKNKEQVRQNLILLRKEIQDENQRRALAYLLCGEYDLFVELLEDPDPKVRKNAALILGEMECEETLEDLIRAYEKEETLFVRSDFLKAIRAYDYEAYLPVLKEQKKRVEHTQMDDGKAKHLREENALLQTMIFQYEKPKKHIFTGGDGQKPIEVILVTNRCQREATKRQLAGEKAVMLAGGIRFVADRIEPLLNIRTWKEMLFPIPGIAYAQGTPENIGSMLGSSKMREFVQKLHSGTEQFCFRVEVKSKMPLEKKGNWIRRMAASLEQSCARKWINAPEEYEIEIRLIQTKEDRFIPLLKFYTIEDNRFSYRKEYLPTSISPVNAALLMELGREYLREGAQVLDPFCGVGTMLIERNACVKARTMYGVDILEEAVEKARENTKRAGLPIHYINRNFFDFEHEYLFDEIVTNFPGKNKNRNEGQICDLYHRFFEKASDHVRDGGILMLYSSERALIQKNCSKYPHYCLKKEYMINEKEKQEFFIIQIKKN